MNKQSKTIKFILISFGLALLLTGLYRFTQFWSESSTEIAIQRKFAKEHENLSKLQFDLSDPEQAPKELKQAVMDGYKLIIDTQTHAKPYVGNALNCTHCHFAGGNTTGGKNGSVSLAGIAAAYPSYQDRFKKVISLSERINSCFIRSLNGSALPYNSDEMIAIETYLHWISRNFPIYMPIPWQGLQMISSTLKPDPVKGKVIYENTCALCHAADGHGGTDIPAVFGRGSFNDAASMADINTLAAFIYANMPYEDPALTPEESFDVASYILEQPRPHLEKRGF